MTQRERVHSMLKTAGSKGVSSKDFIAQYMPRAAARVQELKDSGVKITSEREGKYTRYRLQQQCGATRRSRNEHTTVEAASAQAVAPADVETPGGKSEVPAAAAEAPLFELEATPYQHLQDAA